MNASKNHANATASKGNNNNYHNINNFDYILEGEQNTSNFLMQNNNLDSSQ